MYYMIEIWTDGECETARALSRSQAQELCQGIYDEHHAVREAAGLVPDIALVIHQCVQVIEFKPKGEE